MRMRDRRKTLLWIKDLIDHLSHCHDQLQWAQDDPAQTFLTEAMLADLSECRRLCERLRTPGPAGDRDRDRARPAGVTAKG